jgi:hypothetical protein
MRKMLVAWVVVTVVLFREPGMAQAQQGTEPAGQAQAARPATTESQEPKTDQHGKPIEPYRLDFSFNELESGKKINTRHYSINLTAGSADEVKIGTRVPIATVEVNPSPTQFQYLDLGTSIWALLRNSRDEIQLEVRSEISSTKHEDVDTYPRAPHTTFTPPIVSQIKIDGSTLVVTGKPIVIGSVDDPYSNRQFQLEVTATKLR